MISGAIQLGSEAPFSGLAPAHPVHVEICTVESEHARAFIAVEKDTQKQAVSERFWGQKIGMPAYEALKKELQDWSLQSLLLEQFKHDGRVEMTRNHQAECSLYLMPRGRTLFCHWDPVALYRHIDTSSAYLDTGALLACLELELRYSEHTVFKNIFRLLERGRAVFDANGLKIIRPPHIDPIEAAALKGGVDPVAAFHEMLGNCVSRWPIEPQHVSVILSSGLDTSLVAHMVHERVEPHRLASFGYSMMGKDREAIRMMRREVVERLALDDTYPLIEENFDEAYAGKTCDQWPGLSQTAFAETNLARHMAASNVTLAFTGIGGDELCTVSARERAAMSLKPHRATPGEDGDSYDFFSVVAHDAPERPSCNELSWPNGYVGFSAPDMAEGIGIFYLRQGIWFANPLTSAELHAFAHFLPVEWRYKRRLSREALTRLGYSSTLTTQIPKEGLSETMTALRLKLDWKSCFRNSILCDTGIVDRKRLLEGVDIFNNTRSVNVGIKLLMALDIEMGLRSLHGIQPLAKAV